jgi:hypothetical protein
MILAVTNHPCQGGDITPTVTPALQEVLPTVAAAAANVPGLAKMEIPTASSNMHLEAATTLEVV